MMHGATMKFSQQCLWRFVCCNVTLCGLVNSYQRFGQTYCLGLQFQAIRASWTAGSSKYLPFDRRNNTVHLSLLSEYLLLLYRVFISHESWSVRSFRKLTCFKEYQWAQVCQRLCKYDVGLSVHLCICVEQINQLDATEWFIAFIKCSTCFGHFYAHHQELETICLLLPPMVCNALVAGGRRSAVG